MEKEGNFTHEFGPSAAKKRTLNSSTRILFELLNASPRHLGEHCAQHP